MKMRIRLFALATMLVFGLSGLAVAKTYTLKLGHLSAVGGLEDLASQRIAEVAAERSGGRLQVKIFPAAQLGNMVSMMESLAMGTQDMVWGSMQWMGNFVKDYQIQLLPYAFSSYEHLEKFFDSPIGKDLEMQLEKKGFKIMSNKVWELPKVVVAKKPVFKLEDVKGIKMRLPEWPISMEAWKAAGCEVVIITWGEAYLALAQGVADAMECGFEFVYPAKFHEVAPYITLTNHVLGARGCLMGVKSYNKLPPDLQKIMKEACLEGEKYYNEIILKAKAEHTEKLLKGGAKIIAIDNTAFQEKMLSIADKLEDAGYWRKGLFKEVMALK